LFRPAALILICFLVLIVPNNLIAKTQSLEPLNNSDIVSMTKAGLTNAIILDKIKSSSTNFETTPAALVELKNAGVDDGVIQAMINNSRSPLPTSEKSLAVTTPHGYAISYVQSDQKWQLGFRHEPFNKISAYLEEQLVKDLEIKGIKRVASLSERSCQITLELLSVSTRQAVIKEPGIDLAVNVTITDADKKILYSKGYKGRSGTAVMNTWGHLIDHACEEAAKTIANDGTLTTVLETGKT
jgi:hypothetical protein